MTSTTELRIASARLEIAAMYLRASAEYLVAGNVADAERTKEEARAHAQAGVDKLS